MYFSVFVFVVVSFGGMVFTMMQVQETPPPKKKVVMQGLANSMGVDLKQTYLIQWPKSTLEIKPYPPPRTQAR